ncbi:hypothetical protein LshimejAT787_1401740 [Lyophyllum shimeji]|uniref:Uncharacterized protein n=1 Tax=Lyophyllum shimeji TaxID=47721 RepID=A0A9P3USY9_LYOSH|nr:hypothetical protein LshimejAT787_1401740 [Lyophyllum shimeji]
MSNANEVTPFALRLALRNLIGDAEFVKTGSYPQPGIQEFGQWVEGFSHQLGVWRRRGETAPDLRWDDEDEVVGAVAALIRGRAEYVGLTELQGIAGGEVNAAAGSVGDGEGGGTGGDESDDEARVAKEVGSGGGTEDESGGEGKAPAKARTTVATRGTTAATRGATAAVVGKAMRMAGTARPSPRPTRRKTVPVAASSDEESEAEVGPALGKRKRPATVVEEDEETRPAQKGRGPAVNEPPCDQCVRARQPTQCTRRKARRRAGACIPCATKKARCSLANVAKEEREEDEGRLTGKGKARATRREQREEAEVTERVARGHAGVYDPVTGAPIAGPSGPSRLAPAAVPEGQSVLALTFPLAPLQYTGDEDLASLRLDIRATEGGMHVLQQRSIWLRLVLWRYGNELRQVEAGLAAAREARERTYAELARRNGGADGNAEEVSGAESEWNEDEEEEFLRME